MDQEYLDLFKNLDNEKLENLNEKQQIQENQSDWQNLNVKKEQQKWQSLNETPDLSQYQKYENLNDSTDMDFQFETKINGVVSNNSDVQNYTGNQNHPYHNKQKRKQPQMVDKQLNEVIQEPKSSIPQPETLNESIEDQDVVSVDMFNRMASNAMLELANKKQHLLK